MKRLFLLFTVFFTVSLLNAQQWLNVSEPYIPEALNDIYFVSENTGWAVGEGGIILHTNNGGEEWIKQTSGTDKDLSKVFFIDENTGWIGTGSNSLGGTILKSTDGGENWAEIDFKAAVPNVEFIYFDDILFTDNNTGFLIAGKSKSNYLLKTTDGGETWVKKDSLIATTALRWYSLDFYDNNKGVVAGSAKDKVKYTTDGGETWSFSTAISDPFFKDLKAVHYLSENDVIALGEGQEFSGLPTPIYKSSDGGATWVKKTQSPANSYDRVRGLYFKNSLEGVAVGSNGFAYPFIYKTSDGGETWTPSNANVGFSLFSISGAGDVLYGLGTSGAIIKSTDFGTTWSVYPVITPTSVYDLQFINNKGYAVLSNGTVISSSDEYFEKWNYLSGTSLWPSQSLKFIDEDTGIILKENQFILKTTDAGVTWNSVLSSLSYNSRNKIGGLSFGDASTGYAWMSINDYAEYHVFKTTDAGDNWSEILNIAGPGSLSGDIAFFDANSGFMAGPNMWIKVTTDGGTTWNDAVVNNLPSEYASRDADGVSIMNETTGWIVGSSFVLKTSDKGLNWEYVSPANMETDTTFYTISFSGDTLGYIGTYDGVVYKTTDAGSTWEKDVTYKDVYKFYSSAINKYGEIYFGTSNGNIVKWLKPVDPGVSVGEDKDILPSYRLNQNYPNPFNPATNIAFSIAKQGLVSLKIYDILGREVASVINKELPAGNHNYQFDASSLSTGVYYYTLTSGEFSSTNKMILLK